MADKHGTRSANTSGLQKQKTVDKWIEPSLPDPVPSYRERPNLNIPGLGVLTHMAPLGTLPTLKMQKIVKTDTLSRTRSNNGGATGSSVSTPMEAMTPDPMPNPSSTLPDPHIHENGMGDHVPSTPIAKTLTPTAIPIGTPPAAAATAAAAAAAAPLQPPPSTTAVDAVAGPSYASSIAPTTPSQALHPSLTKLLTLSAPRATFSSSNMMPKPPIRLEAVVLSAIRSARGAGRTHTAFALTDLITNHRHDPNVERVLKAVASSGGNISPALLSEFSGMVQQKKRESRKKSFTGRRESTFAGLRFATPSYNNSSSQPVAAPAAAAAAPMVVVVIDDDEDGDNNARPDQPQPAPLPSPPSFGHIDKKLKSIESSEEMTPSIAEIAPAPMSPANCTNDDDDQHQNNAHRENLSDISRASSPLTDLEDIDEMILHDGKFAPKEPTQEPTTEVAETHERRRRSSKRQLSRGTIKSHPSRSNLTNVARSPTPSLAFPLQSKSHKKTASNVIQKLDINDEREILKRKARNITLNHGRPFAESSIRESLTEPDEESAVPDGAESSFALRRFPSGRPSGVRLVLSMVPKGIAPDDSDKNSPPPLPIQHDLAPPSSTNSRQSTPNIFGRPTRKAKSGPRVKSSPMKTGTVPLAGISRASGERHSPVGNSGFGSTQDDNHDDYCSSCGGGGTIVCCDGDGCRRAYHWLCLDPPREEQEVDPTESIYCNSCASVMRRAAKKRNGLFTSLSKNFDRNNSVAFSLSKDISGHFEGVKVGPQGEYEEIVPVNQKHKNRAGYEEVPDYLRLKDSKGNPILCYRCSRSAAPGQPVITCSYCPLHWHLDCLDPPLANPPNRDRPWRCPCHVDDILDNLPGVLGPAHKFRTIKGEKPIILQFPNNGHIEVDSDPSDEEEQGHRSAFHDESLYGKVYRLPEKGIKLDFITRARHEKELRDQESAQLAASQSQAAAMEHPCPMSSRTLNEQQAALNLTQLASRAVDFDARDKIALLAQVLISQAPDNVVALMAQADATNLEAHTLHAPEKVSLLTFRSLTQNLLRTIDDQLGAQDDQATESATVDTAAAAPASPSVDDASLPAAVADSRDDPGTSGDHDMLP